MVYRRGGRNSTLRASSGSSLSSKQSNLGKNYGNLQSGGWRHQYVANVPQAGATNPMPLGNFFVTRNLTFRRTFNGAVGDDIGPTPTVSNNLGTSVAFNGSRISNYKKIIRLKNTSATVSPTIDIYEVAMSYYDALIWSQVRPAECPFTFDTTVPLNPPYDKRGEIGIAIPAVGVLSANDWSNFKFQQHYLKLKGSVTIGNTDGTNTAEFIIDRVPPKVRRSQTGMMWCHIFVYDTLKNVAANANLEYSEEVTFMEHPSEQRLPYIDQ